MFCQQNLDWSQVHQRIVQLGAERGAHERELCHWLVAAEHLGQRALEQELAVRFGTLPAVLADTPAVT